jgi:hypothetical protein
MSKLEIKDGARFGNLVVIREVEPYKLPSGQTNRAFLMKCDCETEKVVRLLHFYRGRTTSCGCVNSIRDGEGNTKLCKLWRAINRRCSAIAHKTQRRHYFDLSIRVCDEWRDNWDSFRKWAIENGYKEGLQIDRIDSKGNYSPDNCRFITPQQNCNNRGETFRVVYKTIEYAFTDLLDKKDLRHYDYTIRSRIKRGWSVEDAFDKPIRKGNYRKRAKTLSLNQ